jgi:multidrug efflux pump subunit AcrB
MLSVILSIIGVLLGLVITHTPFGIIMTGIGVISLAGVVVNNAIVLLDYIMKLRKRGLERMDAIVTAGKTRFRPVMLTAITTILGLIPLTTGISFDLATFGFEINARSSQWWGPMGVAVIFGLAFATLLTLIVVPVLYLLLDRMTEWFRRMFGMNTN